MKLGPERRDYQAAPLRRAGLHHDPLVQFADWLSEALALALTDATAMALATVAPDLVPSVRIVLLKDYGPDGFTFYTDYRSQKGRELETNPVASALFHWRELERQVRITGVVSRLDAAVSSAYFDSRPLESRLAAAASAQSQPIEGRDALEAAVAALKAAHPDGHVPMPPEWGGYRLQPETYEFWQGREGRLHDRFRYVRGTDHWLIDRLQP